MKLIIAYIQPYKLEDVKKSLFKHEIYKMSITNALGCGQQAGYTGSWKGIEVELQLLKKIRIEIAVNDDFIDKAVDAIIEGAQTNTIGDGKIFVIPIEDCIRIRNRDKGKQAIG